MVPVPPEFTVGVRRERRRERGRGRGEVTGRKGWVGEGRLTESNNIALSPS